MPLVESGQADVGHDAVNVSQVVKYGIQLYLGS